MEYAGGEGEGEVMKLDEDGLIIYQLLFGRA